MANGKTVTIGAEYVCHKSIVLLQLCQLICVGRSSLASQTIFVDNSHNHGVDFVPLSSTDYQETLGQPGRHRATSFERHRAIKRTRRRFPFSLSLLTGLQVLRQALRLLATLPEYEGAKRCRRSFWLWVFNQRTSSFAPNLVRCKITIPAPQKQASL